MSKKTYQIRIESILGGHTLIENFAQEDQFKGSYSIDPFLAISDCSYRNPSGYLRPAPYTLFFNDDEETFTDSPMWIVPQPKGAKTYVYGHMGSTYYINGTTPTELAKIDAASGNGSAYYDNYIYFARDTSVCRYGPLDGTAAMNTDYWVTTLGMAELSDITYPLIGAVANHNMPNHVMLRHNDGSLYFADVVGNQGVLHRIKTTKTTVEGDTDDGSTFNVVDFPFGMYPTAIASYGNLVAVALYEGANDGAGGGSGKQSPRAKLALWDPTNPDTYDLLVLDEYPDEIITALVNSNGILYLFSGQTGGGSGVRITRYLGGRSFEQISFFDSALTPFAGAVDGELNRVVFGSYNGEFGYSSVWQIGSKTTPVSNAIFNVMGCTGGAMDITALKIMGFDNGEMYTGFGWGNGGIGDAGMNTQFYTCPGGANYGFSAWTSSVFRIGQPFKITKLVIPLVDPVSSGMTLTATLEFDDNNSQYIFESIDYPVYAGQLNIVQRPTNAVGQHNFYLLLEWSNTTLMTVSLPITIEYELLNDE